MCFCSSSACYILNSATTDNHNSQHWWKHQQQFICLMSSITDSINYAAPMYFYPDKIYSTPSITTRHPKVSVGHNSCRTMHFDIHCGSQLWIMISNLVFRGLEEHLPPYRCRTPQWSRAVDQSEEHELALLCWQCTQTGFQTAPCLWSTAVSNPGIMINQSVQKLEKLGHLDIRIKKPLKEAAIRLTLHRPHRPTSWPVFTSHPLRLKIAMVCLR